MAKHKTNNERTLEVLFTPAEFAALERRDLAETTCVVFDVLRATSTMVTALANGATAIFPAADIPAAISARETMPEVLLAGERDGLRIEGALTGGISFDLGNSPREFTREKVAGKKIVMTTTNGTRALRSCAQAGKVMIGSFLNLRATAEAVLKQKPANILVVCSGTMEEMAYEDALGAGALCDLLWPLYGSKAVSDSAQMARALFRFERKDLLGAITKRSRNGRRLLAHAGLRKDVPFCLQRSRFKIVAELGKAGWIDCEEKQA